MAEDSPIIKLENDDSEYVVTVRDVPPIEKMPPIFGWAHEEHGLEWPKKEITVSQFCNPPK